ncbi:hypothetical protein DFJ74DRAFT_357339 [Hyaloraphidium curvatum]|nr:hypothetical protein DFJ74DRAFT_357339 [Hyaloraphidium curvatum]
MAETLVSSMQQSGMKLEIPPVPSFGAVAAGKGLPNRAVLRLLVVGPPPAPTGTASLPKLSLLPVVLARVRPPPSSSARVGASFADGAPVVVSPTSPDFWRSPTPPTPSPPACETVVVTRRLDSGLVDGASLLLATGFPTFVQGLAACEVSESDLGLSPYGNFVTPVAPPKPGMDSCVLAACVPDPAWMSAALARRCIELARRKRHFSNPYRHHRRGDTPFRTSPGTSPFGREIQPTPDPEDQEPWAALGCLTDSNVEYMRVWRKEKKDRTSPGVEANFRMLPDSFAIAEHTPGEGQSKNGSMFQTPAAAEEWEVRCSWDILGPLTEPYFLPLHIADRSPQPSVDVLHGDGPPWSSSALALPFISDDPSSYPAGIVSLINLLRTHRQLELDLYLAIPAVQRANVASACGDVLETLASALVIDGSSASARTAGYLTRIACLEGPMLLDPQARDATEEEMLEREMRAAVSFLELAGKLRRSLGRKWEGSVELLAQELSQIRLRQQEMRLSPAVEGIAVGDSARGDDGSVERAAAFRRWQLKKIGERTQQRCARLVTAYYASLRSGAPIKLDDLTFESGPPSPGMGLLSPGPRLGDFVDYMGQAAKTDEVAGGKQVAFHEAGPDILPVLPNYWVMGEDEMPPNFPQRPEEEGMAGTAMKLPHPSPGSEISTGSSGASSSPAISAAASSDREMPPPPPAKDPRSPITVKRLSELLFRSSPAASSKSVGFPSAEAEDVAASKPKRRPPPRSEAFSALLRSLSNPAPSLPSPGTLIATAKTPSASELPALAGQVGRLHAERRGEMGMRTPFVDMSKATEDEEEDEEQTGGEERAKSERGRPGFPGAGGRAVGERVKVERGGLRAGAKALFGLGGGGKKGAGK